MKDPEYIDSLFKNLKEEPATSRLEDTQWAAIEAGIKRKEFYRFSFYRFNIFYALGFFCNFLATGYFIADHFINHHSERQVVYVERNSKIVELSGNEDLNSDKTENNQGPNILDNNIERHHNRASDNSMLNENKANKNLMNPNPETGRNIGQDTTRKDSIKNNDKPRVYLENPLSTQKPPLKPIDEPVKIYKRDTIYKYDSIKVSPKKLRKLKQK